MALKHDRVFQMRASDEFIRSIDDWRRTQSDLPSRAEAIRLLIEAGLKAKAATPSGGTSSGSAKKPATARKAAAPKPRKAGQKHQTDNLSVRSPTSKEAQLRALREQGAR